MPGAGRSPPGADGRCPVQLSVPGGTRTVEGPAGGPLAFHSPHLTGAQPDVPVNGASGLNRPSEPEGPNWIGGTADGTVSCYAA